MKVSRTLSWEADTWVLIDKFMQSINSDDPSAASEELVRAGAEARKVKVK